MKNPKVIFSIIIAAIFITSMIVFRDEGFATIIALFLANATTIGWLWTWFSEEKAKKENKILQHNYNKTQIAREHAEKEVTRLNKYVQELRAKTTEDPAADYKKDKH